MSWPGRRTGATGCWTVERCPGREPTSFKGLRRDDGRRHKKGLGQRRRKAYTHRRFREHRGAVGPLAITRSQKGARSPTVFERFTERARRVIILAREEAGRFRHDFVGTEHILLGLIREDRKSTRLNSSHLGISYAVFCLKKKKKMTYHLTSY